MAKVERIGCQVCLENFHSVGKLKSHTRGKEHFKRMSEVFPQGKSKHSGFFCNINVMEYLAGCKSERPILGLSMMTACHSSELRILFYLCHLCEETCTQGQIMGHLFSPEHMTNYYTYKDPNVLSFSWFPGVDMLEDLMPIAKEDVKKNGNGVLQVLDLPVDLFSVMRSLYYASAISTLKENAKLAVQFNESTTKRLLVQNYMAEPSRKHGLLGLQHLVECLCEGESVKKFHLCTLCQITLRENAIISHVISFDHIYRYISAWHPGTLNSKHCYAKYSPHFKTTISHYAQQAEERSGADNKVKQLTVTPEVFNSLDASYSKALNTLETISKEGYGRSLITSVKPGEPLETDKKSIMTWQGALDYPGLSEECPSKKSLKLRCQNCKFDFYFSIYAKHVHQWDHAGQLRKTFGSAVEEDSRKVGIPNLELCRFIKSEESIIGLSCIVVCICSEANLPAIHLCFACSKYLVDTEVVKHMNSQSHALYTVLRQRVPFAWTLDMDRRVLGQLARQEHPRHPEHPANKHHILKVFDIPYSIFSKLKLSFPNFTKGEDLCNVQHHLRNGVPWACKLKHEYPLLGQDFVVRYTAIHGLNPKHWKCLCLLCGRHLGRKESPAHVLSSEHVKNFLEKAHCGSLDGSDVSGGTLLDLATQAAKTHLVTEIQTIALDEPLLESIEYLKAVQILQTVKWRQSNCELIPVLLAGKRLFPTDILQEGRGHVKSESRSSTPPRPGPPKTGCPPKAEEGVNTAPPDTTSQGHDDLQPEAGMDLEVHPVVKIKVESEMTEEESAPSEVVQGQTIKQEVPPLPLPPPPLPLASIKLEPDDSSWQTPATSPKTEPEDGREEARMEVCTESSSTQTCTIECKKENTMPRKRKTSMSGDKKVRSKRPCLLPEDEKEPSRRPPGHPTGTENATEEASLKDLEPASPQIDQGSASTPAAASSSSNLWDYIKLNDREPVIGLSALLECHCEPHAPIYLCKSCRLKILEDKIVVHITAFQHRKKYLNLPFKYVMKSHEAARLAALDHEQREGFGEAQVVELTPKVYRNILNQGFDFAFKNILQNVAQMALPVPQAVSCKPDGLGTSEEQPLSTSLGLSPALTTASLASGPGKTTHVPLKTKVQPIRNKVTSSATLKCDATLKRSGDDPISQSKVILKLGLPKMIPAKNPVEKLIPAPFTVAPSPVAPSLSQSRVSFASPLVTSPKSIPTTFNMLTSVLKVGSALKSANLPRAVASKNTEVTADKGPMNHGAQQPSEEQQPSLSIALSSTFKTVSFETDKGKSTHVAQDTCMRQTGCPSKSVLPENGVPPKTPVDEFLPAPSITSVATSLHLLPSQSSVTFSKPPVISPKTIPSTMNLSTTSSKLGNPISAVNLSKNTAPTVDKVQRNNDAITMHRSITIPQRGVHSQPAVPAPPISGPLFPKTPGEQSSTSTWQGLGSASPTTPVYSSTTCPPNHTAAADTAKGSSKIHPVVGKGLLVAVMCEKRRQFYCKLCSVRLKNKDHMTSSSHRYKYLKFRFFEWTMEGNSELDEKKMLKMVTHLAEIEKEQGVVVKTVKVNSEMYNLLATASEEQAFAKAMELEEAQGLSSTVPSKAKGHKCDFGPHEASCSAEAWPEEQSDKVRPPAVATGTAITCAPPSSPTALEEVAIPHVPHHHPALPHREPGTKNPRAAPAAEPDQPSAANPDPNEKCGPQMESKGEKIFGQSDLSTFLMVNSKTEPIIGLAFVFECRGLYEDTFYLCGSCMETFPIKLICKHIESVKHQLTYMLKAYPQFISWWEMDLPLKRKQALLSEIAWRISAKESFDKMDAQVILLRKDCYDYIRQAPFIQALDILQNISEKKSNRLSGYQKQLGPQTSNAPATRGPRSADPTAELDLGERVTGIWAIIECSCEGQSPFYLCVACGHRLSRDLVLLHVQGQGHLQVYLSALYPQCFGAAVRTNEDAVLPAHFLQLARELEEQNQDKPSTMQRISLPQEEFNRIQPMTFDQALHRLKTLYNNQGPTELLTCVTSKPQPATKSPFAGDWCDSDRVKRQRLVSPPERETLTGSRSPDVPRLPAERSHPMSDVRGASEPCSSPALAPAPQAWPNMLATQQGAFLKSNFEPNPSRPPPSTLMPLVEPMETLPRTKPVQRADSFPVSCPGNATQLNDSEDVARFLEAGCCSKDGIQCNSKPIPKVSSTKHAVSSDTGSNASPGIQLLRRQETSKETISDYSAQSLVSSSALSIHNCSTGSVAGPVKRIGVITGVAKNFGPQAEVTADPVALPSQNNLGFQENVRPEHGYQSSMLINLLTQPATSAHAVGSTEPSAAHPSMALCSSTSAATQSNNHARNFTEEAPGAAVAPGFFTGQPYYLSTPYPAGGYLDYNTSRPMALDNGAMQYNPALYYAHMNRGTLGAPNGGPVRHPQGFDHSVWPNQSLSDEASRLPGYSSTSTSWGATPSTAMAQSAPVSSYHEARFSVGAANYSNWSTRVHTYSNDIVITNPVQQPQSNPNQLNVQGTRAVTRYTHPQGMAAFHFYNGAGNGTN